MQEDIDKELKKIVQEQLAPAKIVDLKSEEAEDFDRDPILCIRVVYETKDNRLDPMKVLSLNEHLQGALKALSIDRFPIPYYMIPEEVEYLESL